MAASGSILGNPVQRKEDPGLLTGANHYVDDLDVVKKFEFSNCCTGWSA